MQPTIIIDAGHGGFDNGASFEGRKEKNDTLRLALAVGERLEAAGFPVVYTRMTDVYQSPIEKASIANQSGGDFFVSIHRNSSATPNQYSGVQTLIYSNSGIAAKLAQSINEELEQVGFDKINVEERKDLAVLRRTSMPAILIEAGFINSVEDNRIFDDSFDEMADAIASAIENTVNVTQTVMTVGAKQRGSDNNNRARNNLSGALNHLFGVQVGLFRRFENAQYRMEEMIEQGYSAQIIEWNGYYTIVVGKERSLEAAKGVERELNRRGYETLIVNL